MGRIGILSDSHGDLRAFERAVDLLTKKGAGRFIFLGGHYADFDTWFAQPNRSAEQNANFLRVPERDCAAYVDPTIANRELDMIGDLLCCVVHEKNDLTKEDMQNSLLFIHGASNSPNVVQIGPRYFVTPGRLSGAEVPSCALLEEVPRALKFSAFDLEGNELVAPQTMVFGMKTNISVR